MVRWLWPLWLPDHCCDVDSGIGFKVRRTNTKKEVSKLVPAPTPLGFLDFNVTCKAISQRSILSGLNFISFFFLTWLNIAHYKGLYETRSTFIKKTALSFIIWSVQKLMISCKRSMKIYYVEKLMLTALRLQTSRFFLWGKTNSPISTFS